MTALKPADELRDLIRSGEAGRLRSAARISQTTLAAGLGISRPYLSRAENGRQGPSQACREAVAAGTAGTPAARGRDGGDRGEMAEGSGVTSCRHCHEEIVPCPTPTLICEGWKHVRYLHFGPIGAHYCEGRSVNPVAEPAIADSQGTSGDFSSL